MCCVITRIAAERGKMSSLGVLVTSRRSQRAAGVALTLTVKAVAKLAPGHFGLSFPVSV